jgi:hypothetical protein
LLSKPEAGKLIVWLRGEVKTPPFSKEARIEACKRRVREYDRLVSARRGCDEEK